MYAHIQKFRNSLLANESKTVSAVTGVQSRALAFLQTDLAKLEYRIDEMQKQGLPPTEVMSATRDALMRSIQQCTLAMFKVAPEVTALVEAGLLTAAEISGKGTNSNISWLLGLEDPNLNVDSFFTPYDNDRIRTLAAQLASDSPVSKLINDMPSRVGISLREGLIKSIATGTGPRQLVSAMRHSMGTVPASRLSTIARTEMIRNSRIVSQQIYQDSDVVLGYERQATQDARVCIGCLALNGQQYKKDELMPSHPNCRCVMVPVIADVSTLDSGNPQREPSLVVPTDELLDGLFDADIMAIMGPARYALWRKGTSLTQMVGVKDNRTWGPTIEVLPINKIGQPAPKPKPAPKPAPVPTPVPTPAPVQAPVAPQPATPQPATPLTVNTPVHGQRGTNNPNRIYDANEGRYKVDVDEVVKVAYSFGDEIEKANDAIAAAEVMRNNYNFGTVGYDKANEAYRLRAAEKVQLEIDQVKRIENLLRAEIPLDRSHIKLGLTGSFGDRANVPKADIATLDGMVNQYCQFIENRPVNRSVQVWKYRKQTTGNGVYYRSAGGATVNIGWPPDRSTVFHELTHWLEDIDQASAQRRIAVWDKLTNGLTQKMMWFGMGFSEGAEWTFRNYCGRIYPWEPPRGKGQELLTVGLEGVFRYPSLSVEKNEDVFRMVLECL